MSKVGAEVRNSNELNVVMLAYIVFLYYNTKKIEMSLFNTLH